MQNLPRILIVLPVGDVPALKQRIFDEAAMDAHTAVRVVGLNGNPAASERQTELETNTQKIIEILADGDFDKVIVHERVPLDERELPRDARIVSSIRTLYKELTTALKDCGLYWLDHACSEWNKSSIKHLSPQAWVEQLARVGHVSVAKNLLKSLRVIDDTTLRNSFYTRKEEMLGLRVGHGFFSDEEKGSSSIAVQQVLEHLYPGKIHKFQIENSATWASLNLDRLYVYEDGLWSGVELLRRLQSIAESPEFSRTEVHFYFKFAATSDVGLVAARLLARRLKTSRFHFIPADVDNHFEFFKGGCENEFSELPPSVAALRSVLDDSVEPYAFKRIDVWENERDQAIAVCKQIGSQLVIPFLLRKKEEKEGKSGDSSERPDVSDLGAERWELGAMNFASTIVFSSSIPKPVLPLMWLQGDVEIGRVRINWRPLFWDVRRTGVYE